jgi:hypothetical protein
MMRILVDPGSYDEHHEKNGCDELVSYVAQYRRTHPRTTRTAKMTASAMTMMVDKASKSEDTRTLSTRGKDDVTEDHHPEHLKAEPEHSFPKLAKFLFFNVTRPKK